MFPGEILDNDTNVCYYTNSMDKTFGRALMAVAVFTTASTGETVAQTARASVQSEWDLERDAAASRYRRQVSQIRTELMGEIVEEREGLDITRGLSAYLQANTNLRLCQYDPRRPDVSPTVAQIIGSTVLDDQYGFWARSLAREEVELSNDARQEVSQDILSACGDVRDAGAQLEGELIGIAADEARARRDGR